MTIFSANSDWDAGVRGWLDATRSENTRRAYATAVLALMKSSGKMIDEISRADIADWASALRKANLANSTISQRLAAISGMYRFLMDDYTLHGPDGEEHPLTTSNPAGSKKIRPHVTAYNGAVWLSADEAQALLRVIDRGTPQGARDYALFLGYLLLGRRNSEWRTTTIEAFRRMDGKMRWSWSGKGKENQWMEVPTPVWNAIVFSFAMNGRDQAGFVFGSDKTTTGKPITGQQANRLLKHYCKMAGLDPVAIHVHSLRHSAAMLRKKAGDRLEDISTWLVHSSVATTQIYVHALQGQDDSSWMRVSQLLGI